MVRMVRRLVKLALILVVAALVLDLHYKGKSSRQYAKDYGQKALQYLHRTYKNLVGKDLEELTPKSLSDLPKKVKSLTEDPEKKELIPPSNVSAPPVKEEISKLPSNSPTIPPPDPKIDGLTEEDREQMRKLLEEKMKKN